MSFCFTSAERHSSVSKVFKNIKQFQPITTLVSIFVSSTLFVTASSVYVAAQLEPAPLSAIAVSSDALRVEWNSSYGFSVCEGQPRLADDESHLATRFSPEAATDNRHGSFMAVSGGTSVCVPRSTTLGDSSASATADTPEVGDKPTNGSKGAVQGVSKISATDFGREFYYKNKTEFGLDVGWLPINIPFAFDIFLGDGYNNPPLYYTLMPVIGSLRWQVSDIGGPWIFRGNWDIEASGAVVIIPRGPESRYFAWIMGARRNFVPHRGKIAPYFDFRLGLGNIDAKEPKGVQFAQGENYTFTLNVGSGVRYNLNQKYAVTAGIHYMHISNLYLSEPKYPNYGINCYGPMIGMTMRLGKPHDSSGE